eukprot:CAMPEP_0171799304 /NCGR_PEP_ID=MMETSP0991-20121206/71047_1 /TAXON_ID=483369 /ORGANISM="non described non described, Strain CCMP2098" /LENGTH=354 /DNA_ID=CAMNT_0012410683 /DNA_START=281 /DNA_END=1344 /DNA_ORIENTATION=-
MGNPRFIAAPMVQQSDLAFRLLVRRHGCDLAFTQMLHSRNFVNSAKFRKQNWDPLPCAPGEVTSLDASAGLPFDRPLIAQFAGDDPDVVVKAASYVKDQDVDAVDAIARKGHYGAFLLREPLLVEALVKGMVANLTVPVTVKMRVLEEGPDATIEFAKMIEACGASMLTLHGRTLKQNKNYCGSTDMDTIRRVNAALAIPVVANGGVETTLDALRILRFTGCAAVMSSEALLENPALFCPKAVAVAQRRLEKALATQAEAAEAEKSRSRGGDQHESLPPNSISSSSSSSGGIEAAAVATVATEEASAEAERACVLVWAARGVVSGGSAAARRFADSHPRRHSLHGRGLAAAAAA